MNLDVNSLVVTHKDSENRFEIALGNQLALLRYRKSADRMIINHTEVPRTHEGRGIAAKMTRAALDYARREKLHVVPTCPYTAAFIRRNSEYQDLLTPEDLKRFVNS